MTLSSSLKSNAKQFGKYAVVGIAGTLIDVGGFTLLIAFTPLNRFIAASLSFIAAVINNFTFNRLWTFQDTRPIAELFPKFLAVSLIGLALNLGCLWFYSALLQWILQIGGLLPAGAAIPTYVSTLGKIGASGTVFLYNYLANKWWTFQK